MIIHHTTWLKAARTCLVVSSACHPCAAFFECFLSITFYFLLFLFFFPFLMTDGDSMTINNLRDSANGTFVTLDDYLSLTLSVIGTPTSPTAKSTDICQPLDLAYKSLLKSALRVQCARSVAHVLHLFAEEVPDRPNTFKLNLASDERAHVVLPSCAKLKHRPDLHHKAWRRMRVKKHEADTISHEARLWRSELFGERDTSARPAVEPTSDVGIDGLAPLA